MAPGGMLLPLPTPSLWTLQHGLKVSLFTQTLFEGAEGGNQQTLPGPIPQRFARGPCGQDRARGSPAFPVAHRPRMLCLSGARRTKGGWASR